MGALASCIPISMNTNEFARKAKKSHAERICAREFSLNARFHPTLPTLRPAASDAKTPEAWMDETHDAIQLLRRNEP